MEPTHNHPMVRKEDVSQLNEQYRPWRIEKIVRGNAVAGSRIVTSTQARNTDTGEVIYRAEGWSQASRGQALNAILERRATGTGAVIVTDEADRFETAPGSS